MPNSICLIPTCPEPATYRGRCSQHTTQRNRETRSQNAAIYNTKRWKMTRRAKLATNPLCEHPDCQQIATDVHHITDLQAGGNPWTQNNLQALCHTHHSQETRRRQT